MAYVWQYCDCGHPDDDHRTNGPCRAADAYGYPCECRQFDDGQPTLATDHALTHQDIPWTPPAVTPAP